jgi:hypothetical protein
MAMKKASTMLAALATAWGLSIGIAGAQGEGTQGLYVGTTVISPANCMPMDFHIRITNVGGGQEGTIQGYAFATNMTDVMSAVHGKVANGMVTMALTPMHGPAMKGELKGTLKDGKLDVSMNGTGCNRFTVSLPQVTNVPNGNG